MSVQFFPSEGPVPTFAANCACKSVNVALDATSHEEALASVVSRGIVCDNSEDTERCGLQVFVYRSDMESDFNFTVSNSNMGILADAFNLAFPGGEMEPDMVIHLVDRADLISGYLKQRAYQLRQLAQWCKDNERKVCWG